MTPLIMIVSAALGATSPSGIAACDTAADRTAAKATACELRIDLTLANQTEDSMQQHPYVGMWVTEDGRIRQELLPNGRYDEARGTRQSAYVGRYEVTGNEIFYWDDSGFTADGEFVDMNTLHHGGMVFLREE